MIGEEMVKKMNIAIITPTLFGGGAERVAGYLSKELNNEYNVYLVVEDLNQCDYNHAGTIIDLGMVKRKNGITSTEALRMIKEKNEIDCAISFLETYNFANIMSAGKEIVIISERCAQTPFNQKLANRYIKQLYPYADAIVTCAEGVKYDLVHNLGLNENNITTIYNFIDKESITEKANAPFDKEVTDFLGGNEYFVNIGRLAKQKNQKRLINQFKCYKEKSGNNIKLIIKGTGPEEDSLKALIRREGLENEILLLGYSTNNLCLLKYAKAFILSSHFEGLPNVLLEAFVLGCPVISTDCLSGPRELLDDDKDYKKNIKENKIAKRGILCPDVLTDDEGETLFLAAAMEKICNDEGLRTLFIEEGKNFIANYSQNEIKMQWKTIIGNTEKKDRRTFLDEMAALNEADEIYIYGAGKVGHRIFEYVKKRYKIDGFVVTQKNDDCVKDVLPIFELDEVKCSKRSAFIIGVGLQFQDEVYEEMKKRGISNIVWLH